MECDSPHEGPAPATDRCALLSYITQCPPPSQGQIPLRDRTSVYFNYLLDSSLIFLPSTCCTIKSLESFEDGLFV